MKKIRAFLDRFDLDRCTARNTMYTLWIIGTIILLICGGLHTIKGAVLVGFILFFVLLVAGFIVYEAYGRCPHCGKSIDPRDSNAYYCSGCGKELD